MPVSSSWSVPEASSHASPRGCYSCCCFILARSAFQPPSLLTPLLAGLSLLYAASTGLAHQDIWVGSHMAPFHSSPFFTRCQSSPAPMYQARGWSPQFTGREWREANKQKEQFSSEAEDWQVEWPEHDFLIITRMQFMAWLFPNSISKLAGTTLNPCLGANPSPLHTSSCFCPYPSPSTSLQSKAKGKLTSRMRHESVRDQLSCGSGSSCQLNKVSWVGSHPAGTAG